MDKAILKKFAIESRKDLMEKIQNKIKTFYVDEVFSNKQKGELYVLSNEKHSLSLTNEEYKKRELLIKRIKELSLEQVIEEASYTWFNRIIAIRYMEINDILPLTKDNQSLGIRVLSSKDNTPDPEILKFTNITNSDLDIDLKKEIYSEFKEDNDKFKYVLLLVCKKLGKVIPQVFGGVTDYIDILIPDNLLNDTGFITKVIKEVPENNYNQVEIIGWLYQYYISEKKEEVFYNLRNDIKASKEDIPSATQLFTPDWIVKYMVENTLGRYFEDTSVFEFYIKNINKDIKQEKYDIENITFLDPCCGSGHILVYALELMFKLYKERGYTNSTAIENILEKNIYGIDIDERAVQLTILSLCLKAREYDKNIFSKETIRNLNIIFVQQTNDIDKKIYEYYVNSEENRKCLEYLLDIFNDAKEYGSLIKCKKYNYLNLKQELNKENIIGIDYMNQIIKQAIIMSKQYSIVCTNPPYMGRKSINNKLSKYLNDNYPETKSEMYSAFIERCNIFTEPKGYQAMITIHTWMFISSFEGVRKLLLRAGTIINMVHTGPSTFPDLSSFNVLATAFCLKKDSIEMETTFVRLVDYYNSDDKINNFNNIKNYYYLNQNSFKEISSYPFVYWISDKLRKAFKDNNVLGNFCEAKQGLATGDNKKFVRIWHEVSYLEIAKNCKSIKEFFETNRTYALYNKGGIFRKWYGNFENVIKFNRENYSKLLEQGNHLPSRQYYFQKGITWSLFGFENFGVRFKDYGYVFDVSGSSMFPNDENLYYVIGYLCSNVAFKFLSLLAPTVNFQVGNIINLPYKECNNKEEINELVKENIRLCEEDWNSFETSIDFNIHPLIRKNENLLRQVFEKYKKDYNLKRETLRSNEERLNKIYSNIFNVIDDIEISVNDRDLTIKELDKEKLIKSFISYAVGCMFGRYSLDEDGLIYAGGNFDINRYKLFKADVDNVIPIADNIYFEDDIVSRFKNFIEVVYGKENLYENLDFIAEALSKKGTETSEDTIRRYFLNDFYNDHVKTYQKRPIYWLFDSGKKNGFKALIYMHRYNENLVPKVRLDYLHRIQTTYEKLLSDVNYRLTTDLSMTDKKLAENRKADLNAKLEEIKKYDEKIAHIANQRISIDLDDGVKTNYEKFKDILAKIE